MLMMLALAGRLSPSKGPADAGPADADDARPAPSVPARGQLMLMMLAPQARQGAN